MVCASTLSACGSAGGGPDPAGDRRSTPTATISSCLEVGASKSAKVDLDGDGTPEDVDASASGRCPGSVSAKIDGSLVSGSIEDRTPVTAAFGVTLEGRDSQLVVTRQDHPRGGFQVRIFALDGEKLTELTDGGNALVPFVATDVSDQDPLSVDCDGDRIVVTRGVTHEPVGVLPAWDITETSYTLDGAEISDTATAEVADNVLPKQLPQKYPALVKHTLFASCR